MKSILIIGMGRFGRHLAARLTEQGNEVMAIDKVEERVNEVLPFVTNAQIGDSVSEPFIASLGVRNFDLCVVAIGDNFQSSLETTALLKDCGAKLVLARASRDVHAKFLLRNGADKVVYVEKEMAERIAFKYGTDNIFDYVNLTPEYGIYEIPVPPSWLGKSIIQKEVRSKFHVSILATKIGEQIYPLPKPDHVFTDLETLIIIGHNQDVMKISKMK
ncbi:potassium channel family protein [Bacilliculturomica massiliensis]|uniref:potassium channel family protein n=1 Tax=Bacilliculturomica massiliensis TaxID=1917867 RepID=UPI0010325ABB|nr:TrkA family potassium uptake protein [Bacilliculturomica massiliensis]